MNTLPTPPSCNKCNVPMGFIRASGSMSNNVIVFRHRIYKCPSCGADEKISIDGQEVVHDVYVPKATKTKEIVFREYNPDGGGADSILDTELENINIDEQE